MSNISDSSPLETTAGGLAELRMDYGHGDLHESDLSPDPIVQFDRWMADARAAHRTGMDEPHAMTLATADAAGLPSARTVLLKGVDQRGFTWFTNYGSRKGMELAENPHAALNFRWGSLERQVVVMGVVAKVSAEESDEYFYSRPLGSRIGAIVSAQSTVIQRSDLDDAAAALAGAPESSIVRPAHWGGYRLTPSIIEFWQGRSSRLHDRLRFSRKSDVADWVLERLAP
jgi:pyridoxamine 5'-phosphate oxidase